VRATQRGSVDPADGSVRWFSTGATTAEDRSFTQG
jgi:hypothetical protein